MREKFEQVPIAFVTVLVKREFLPRFGIGNAESDRSTSLLAAFVFMDGGEAERFVVTLGQHGIIPGDHVGMADMMHGPMIKCDGIEYVRDDERIPPAWAAFRFARNSVD